MKEENCKFNSNNNISDIELEKIHLIRNDFPILKSNIVYFDSSATTQKPKQVLNEINKYYAEYCSNIGRGSYEWAKKANKQVEETRKKVAHFINANEEEIIFTSGATESSNLIAYSYMINNLKENDEILLCQEDHKSTIFPWLNIINIMKKFNININARDILIDFEGDYKEEDLISKVNDKTKLVVLTHIHNVYGLEMDINLIVPRIRKKNPNCKIILDCSQSIGHIKVDVKKLDIDFAYFSGHKMFSETGIGICYIKKENINNLSSFKVGGGQDIQEIQTDDKSKVNQTLEGGTQNISGIISLGAAIDYINHIGIELIEKYILYLTRYLYEKLKEVPNIEFSKGIDKCSCKIGFGIITFKINKINSSELGEILNDYGIYVRTGDFCKTTKLEDSIRISLHIYNNNEDVDKLIKVLKYITSEQ